MTNKGKKQCCTTCYPTHAQTGEPFSYCKCHNTEEPNNKIDIAKKFHDTYEKYAPDFGYETREDTKEFDPNSKNGKLMIKVCNEIAEDIRTQAIKEAVEFEMRVLKRHLDEQIYQPTVNTHTIYQYIEDRLKHLNKD